MVFHRRRLCEVVRVTHDDGVELTFDNIVNDSSLYASNVLNRIEKIDPFRKKESNQNIFSELECSSFDYVQHQC